MRGIARHIPFAVGFGTVVGILSAPAMLPLYRSLANGKTIQQAFPWMLGSSGFGEIADYWTSYYAVQLLQDIPAALAWLSICILALLVASICSASKNPEREQKGGVFGSQTSEKSVGTILHRCHTWDGGRPEHVGFVVGYARRRYIIAAVIHAVLCAPSGSYKTRASVLPSAACITYTGENNVVMTDPSLEIYCFSRRMLEARGYRVYPIDLENPFRSSARVNFLLPMVKLHRQGLDYLAEERAAEIGALMFPETGHDRDDFAQPASGLVSAVAYVVATSEDVPDECRHLYTVIRIILEGTTGNDSAPLKEWLRGFGADSVAVGMSATFLAASDRYEASILGTLHTGLKPFNTTAMRYLTSGNDLDFEAFLTIPAVLVLHTLSPGMPGNKAASLLLAQLWAATIRNGQRRGANRPTYYLLDEAHSVPPFGLPTILEQSRKYDCHFALYLQSLSGLDPYKTAKEDGKDAILANCDCKCLFRAGSLQDAQYFEQLGGKATYLARNTGESRNSRDASSSTGYSERERPVWMAGDVIQRDPMKDGVLLFQNPTNDPEKIGKFEVPIEEISEVPFAVRQFGTIGSRDYEQRIISAELDRLNDFAAERMATVRTAAWVPNFGEESGEIDEEAELFGL